LNECPRCKGAGKVNSVAENEELGVELKQQREQLDISLRAVARHMGKSPTYLSRLEHGKERWNADLEKSYRAAIGQ